MQKKLLVLLPLCLLVGVAIGVAVKNYLIPSTGYYTGELLIEPSSIDWGNLTRGNSSIRSVNLTNSGPDIASLNMTYSLKTGTLYDYTLSWDAEDKTLATGYFLTATFNLTIYDADEGNFEIDIAVADA